MFRRIVPCLVLTVACKPSVEVGGDYTLTLDLIAASEQDPLSEGDLALSVNASGADAQFFDLGPTATQRWEVVDLGALDHARLAVFTVDEGTSAAALDWSAVRAWGQSAPLTADVGDALTATIFLSAWGNVATYGLLDALDASFGAAAVRLSSGDVLLFGGTDDPLIDGLTPGGAEADDLRAQASDGVYRLSLAGGGVFERAGDLPEVAGDVGAARVFASAVAVTVDGREQVLLTGGRRAYGTPAVSGLGSALLWDPAADEVTWTGMMQRSSGLSQHASFVLPTGNVLLVGGFADLDVSGLTYQTWTAEDRTFSAAAMADGAGAIGAGAAQLLDGSVLVCGGGTKSSQVTTVLDPRDGCVAFDGNGLATGAGAVAAGVADRGNAARMWHAMATLTDGRILLTGGVSASVGGAGDAAVAPALNDAFLYDPGARTWTRTGRLVTARAMHRMVALADGTVLVIGGATQGTGMPATASPTALSSVERYDPSTGTFTEVALSAAGGGALPTLAVAGPSSELGYGAFLMSGMRPAAGAPAWGLTPTGLAD